MNSMGSCPRISRCDMSKPDIITFVCRLNAYESEVMRHEAAKAGLENAVIFNTCAVTAEAVRQKRVGPGGLWNESFVE